MYIFREQENHDTIKKLKEDIDKYSKKPLELIKDVTYD